MNTTQNSPGSAATLGILTVLAATISISLSSIFAPFVYAQGSNPQTLTIFRFACFALVCGAWLALRGTPVTLSRRDLAHCVGAGIIYTIGSASLITAFAYIPITLSVLILYLFPLLTRLGESLFDRRWPSLAEIACLVVALIGLAICLGIALDQLNLPGLVFSVIAAFGVAGSFLWTGRKLPVVPPTVTTFYMAVTGLVAALLFATATGSWALPPAQTGAVLAMAAAALSFAGGFLGMFVGVRLVGASRAAMVMNFEPVATIILAMLILGEILSITQLIGAALVIAAIVTAQRLPAHHLAKTQ